MIGLNESVYTTTETKSLIELENIVNYLINIIDI